MTFSRPRRRAALIGTLGSFLPLLAWGQGLTINTVAGNGGQGYFGDNGPATSAELWAFAGLAVDAAGDVFIADTGNSRIRKVTPDGTITTIVGDGIPNFSGDGGPALNAELNFPRGVAVDGSGNLYIADTGNARIRRISTAGIITTIAGDGNNNFSGDGGPAVLAELYLPWQLAIDAAGNLFIVDRSNQRIRKIAIDGTISTVAGNGTEADSGDGGLAISAGLYVPDAVAVDLLGNIYITEGNGASLRKVTTDGIIHTIVGGNANFGFSGDGGPAALGQLNDPQGVAVDAAGNIYISDEDNQRIRMITTDGNIHTVAGNGTAAFSGDGGPAANSTIDLPEGIASGPNGIYFVDSGNKRIRVLTLQASMTVNTGTTPQSSTVSTAFGAALGVTVKDGTGNPVSGVGVTFNAPTSGASGTFSNSTVTIAIATNSSGVASAPFTANATSGGPYNVSASAAGLTLVNFSLTNTAATAAPPAPVLISPANGAAGMSLVASLNWNASAGAASYDVYFGASSPPPFVMNTTATTYSPGTLAANTPYSWYVVARNPFGTAPSTTFSFTTQGSALQFYPVTPCRLVDTRGTAAGFNGIAPFSGPSILAGGTLTIPVQSAVEAGTNTTPAPCGTIPSTAQAYSLNVTVVPHVVSTDQFPGVVHYISLWPAGVAQPFVSTLNDSQGEILANAAIVPAGNSSGGISIYNAGPATADVILDMNGYFAATTTQGSATGLQFFPVSPCRLVDTRGSSAGFNGISPFSGPSLLSGTTANIPVQSSSESAADTTPAPCGTIPSGAEAYSLNTTLVPHAGGLDHFITLWPSGLSQPTVSTLNDQQGEVVANAAIVPAGTPSGGVSVYNQGPATADVILDMNGYFAAPTGLRFYPVSPCRLVDTRGTGAGFNGISPFSGPSIAAGATITIPVQSATEAAANTTPAPCGIIPSNAQAYSLNLTVVPKIVLTDPFPGAVNYVTIWPAGLAQPVVSTLNDQEALVVANAAIVPAGSGSGGISVYNAGPSATDVVLDMNGYFAP